MEKINDVFRNLVYEYKIEGVEELSYLFEMIQIIESAQKKFLFLNIKTKCPFPKVFNIQVNF